MFGHCLLSIVKVVVGITGASGVIYGVRLLRALKCHKALIVSEDAADIAKAELSMSAEDIAALADESYDNSDLFSPLASGSVKFDSMAVVPCSMSTMSKIAVGICDNLITRVASVALKERRRLVIVTRETPISTIHLANMERLSAAGAVVMPASPAFYPMPRTVDEIVDFIVGRVMDELGIENDLYRRWAGRKSRSTGSRGSRRTPR